MIMINRRGIIMPIIFGLVLCIAIWIGSLAWSMTNNRSRYQLVLKSRQANFMARSAFQHFFLKFRTMQRYCPEAIRALEQANKDQQKKLNDVFIEDILIPPDDKFTAKKLYYRINDFRIASVDYEKSLLIIEISSEGRFGSEKNLLKQLVQIRR